MAYGGSRAALHCYHRRVHVEEVAVDAGHVMCGLPLPGPHPAGISIQGQHGRTTTVHRVKDVLSDRGVGHVGDRNDENVTGLLLNPPGGPRYTVGGHRHTGCGPGRARP
jgi:hypothetical protein